MDQTALYEGDIYAWSQHQARVLRGLAGTGLALPDDLDLENVAEEIESVGNGQRFAAEDGLLQALVRLIKVVALPGDQAVRHWTKEANAFLHNAARRYRPSMRRDFDHGKLWSDAVRLAAADLRDETGTRCRRCRRSALSAWRNSWAAMRTRGSWRPGSPTRPRPPGVSRETETRSAPGWPPGARPQPRRLASL